MILLLACTTPTEITMSGSVWTSTDGDATIPGATVRILDEEAATFDEVVADDAGTFSITVPAGQIFYALVSADGYVETGFSGLAGIDDFVAPDGYPWAPTEAWADEERAAFSACATWSETGPFVSGQVLGSIGAGDLVIVETGTVTVIDEVNAVEYPACYLDDDGESLEKGTETGETGLFAVFGVPDGPIVADVRYTDPGGEQAVEFYQYVMPEAGYVPMYPALISLL